MTRARLHHLLEASERYTGPSHNLFLERIRTVKTFYQVQGILHLSSCPVRRQPGVRYEVIESTEEKSWDNICSCDGRKLQENLSEGTRAQIRNTGARHLALEEHSATSPATERYLQAYLLGKLLHWYPVQELRPLVESLREEIRADPAALGQHLARQQAQVLGQETTPPPLHQVVTSWGNTREEDRFLTLQKYHQEEGRPWEKGHTRTVLALEETYQQILESPLVLISAPHAPAGKSLSQLLQVCGKTTTGSKNVHAVIPEGGLVFLKNRKVEHAQLGRVLPADTPATWDTAAALHGHTGPGDPLSEEGKALEAARNIL